MCFAAFIQSNKDFFCLYSYLNSHWVLCIVLCIRAGPKNNQINQIPIGTNGAIKTIAQALGNG